MKNYEKIITFTLWTVKVFFCRTLLKMLST